MFFAGIEPDLNGSKMGKPLSRRLGEGSAAA